MTRRQASWASGSAHSGPARFPTKSWFMFCPKTWIRFRGGTWIMFGPRTWIKFLCNYLSKKTQVFFLKMAVFLYSKICTFWSPTFCASQLKTHRKLKKVRPIWLQLLLPKSGIFCFQNQRFIEIKNAKFSESIFCPKNDSRFAPKHGSRFDPKHDPCFGPKHGSRFVREWQLACRRVICKFSVEKMIFFLFWSDFRHIIIKK